MFIRFDMIHERDRRTETPHDDIGRTYASHRAAKMKYGSILNLLLVEVLVMPLMCYTWSWPNAAVRQIWRQSVCSCSRTLRLFSNMAVIRYITLLHFRIYDHPRDMKLSRFKVTAQIRVNHLLRCIGL